MGKKIKDLKVNIGQDLEEKLKILEPNYSSYRILKKSVDARTKQKPHWVYSLEVFGPDEEPPADHFDLDPIHTSEKPIIVGSGPAGLFAAIRFVEKGVPCHIFERGSPCEKRIVAINRYWRYGELNPEDNVCFGEGGAGLYSDGKLITRIKSPHIPYVMRKFVEFGAPAEIEFLANPHVGSDRIRRLIPVMRQYLINKGCEFHFNTKVEEILCEDRQVTGIKTSRGETFHSHHVVLATGHSAEDIFHHLSDLDVAMEGKSFAMGLRVEHPQKWVNQTQYREYSEHPELGSANYKLTYHNKREDVGVYSFCMCPGGYVLSSGTEADGVVCNGMSNFKRNSIYANAAIVVSIDHEKYFPEDIFGGLKMRRHLEHKAYAMVQEKNMGHKMPAQSMVDFLLGRDSGGNLMGSSPSGLASTRLDQLFPDKIYLHLCEAFERFQGKMKGFIDPHANLYAVESRTSCPVRILRDDDSFQSTSHKGLYPCGEGAGFAGGITSAACDGIRVAESICQQLQSQTTISAQ
ncbi:MAG: hypothetical protein KDD33_09445 [Bdellovibrionales bacterium]|nr:hypothetical protein [Bdellovibrionales bacterium]